MKGVEVDIRFAGAGTVNIIIRSDNRQNITDSFDILEEILPKIEITLNSHIDIFEVGDQHDRDPGYNPKPMFIGTKVIHCLLKDFRALVDQWLAALRKKFKNQLFISLPSK